MASPALSCRAKKKPLKRSEDFPNSIDARCDYKPASFFNVLAAFWIQFMTHDWFSHLDEGRNAPELMRSRPSPPG